MRRSLSILFFSLLLPILGLTDGPKRGELTLKDIPAFMQEIFTQHVTYKKMDEEIMGRAIKLFIEQFDPHKIYLLASEVERFTPLTAQKLAQQVKAFNAGNYTIFEQMVRQFQEAILRARRSRREFHIANYQAVEDALAKQLQNPLLSDMTRFMQQPDELEARLNLRLLQQVQKLGREAEAIKRTLPINEAIKDVEASYEPLENSYLYMDMADRPLSAQAREDLFTTHILKALLASLDAHSSFLDRDEAYTLKMKLEKGFDGIGLVVDEQAGAFYVSRLLKGSSAEKSEKVKVGDEIVAIDGISISSWTMEQVLEKLQGKAGSEVILDLKHRSESGYDEQEKVRLQRQKIILQEGRCDVSFEKYDGGIIGKIALHSFYEGPDGISAVNDMRKAIDDLKQKGDIKGLVLDLRDNRGGFLMQAVGVAGLFIKSGVVVISKTADGKEHFFRDLKPDVAYSGPLVILTSRLTASAAEIVAQALQDYGVAVVVGDERTYGKGSIQTQTVTSKGVDSPLKITVGKYFSVSGKSTQVEGVKADVIVPSVFFDRQVGEEFLHFPLEEESVPAAFDDQLKDIDPIERDWYLKYYTPYLQKRTPISPEELQQLAERSHKRMAANQEYQRFLAGMSLYKVVRAGDKEETVKLSKAEAQKRVTALQMQEAVNVVKDLILEKSSH